MFLGYFSNTTPCDAAPRALAWEFKEKWSWTFWRCFSNPWRNRLLSPSSRLFATQTLCVILPFPLERTNVAPLVGTCPYGLLVFKSLHFTLWKECRFYHATYGRPRQLATVTFNSLVMLARVWGETVLEAQRAPMTLIQFSHGIESQCSKTFSALTGGDEATYCALGIKINESLMASAFPDRAAVIRGPRSSTVLAQFNDTPNYLAACHKCPDDSFGNRISVLQRSWFVITHMLGGETGSAHAPALDLCHHVSSCFSFWGQQPADTPQLLL